MGDFEGLRAAVVPGDGVVARFPGIVCVARCDPADDAHLRTLLDLCRDAAGSAPGRQLARRLATWLGGADTLPETLRFGTVAATGEDGLAVFCVGAVTMTAAEIDVTISGTDSAAWADRLLARPDSPVLLVLDGTAVDVDLPSSVHDLRAGVVPGAAVAMLASDLKPGATPSVLAAAAVEVRPAPPPVPAPPVPEPEPQPAPVAAAPVVEAPVVEAPVAAAPVEEPPTQLLAPAAAPVSPPGPVPDAQPRPPRRAEPILAAPAEEVRPPLDARGTNGAAEEPTAVSPRAHGHLCSRGHLNDPRSHFCVLCGIRMNQQTGVIVVGARPPLGLLVFDDGSTYTVDADYLLGRMPETDDRVSSGSLRPIAIEDSSGAVSRAHAEVRIEGWDVVLVDSGSRNGTHLAGPGAEDWTVLPPGQSRRLEPGTRVRVGGRTFIFESPSGVR